MPVPVAFNIFIFVLVLFFVHNVKASGDKFVSGLDAYKKGNFQAALKNWLPLAEAGNPYAQSHVAMLYSRGEGVKRNYKTAVVWYTKAAKNGDSAAQTNLGWMYRNGKGVIRNSKSAFNWFKRAAENGFSKAQYNLGVMYLTGEGISRNFIRAYMWFSIAALQEHKNALKAQHAVAKIMSFNEISKGQQLAVDCMTKNYEGCK